MQLHRHGEAIAYLYERGVRTPELIEHMQIGYAPGGSCLRRWLTQLGYPFSALRQAGLVTAVGYDTYTPHRLSAGRQPLWPQSLGFGAASPLSARYQGQLVWLGAGPAIRRRDSRRGPLRLRRVMASRFHNVTCSMGNHLNAHQFQQLCDARRTVF